MLNWTKIRRLGEQTVCQNGFLYKKMSSSRHFGINYFVIFQKCVNFALRILYFNDRK